MSLSPEEERKTLFARLHAAELALEAKEHRDDVEQVDYLNGQLDSITEQLSGVKARIGKRVEAHAKALEDVEAYYRRMFRPEPVGDVGEAVRKMAEEIDPRPLPAEATDDWILSARRQLDEAKAEVAEAKAKVETLPTVDEYAGGPFRVPSGPAVDEGVLFDGLESIEQDTRTSDEPDAGAPKVGGTTGLVIGRPGEVSDEQLAEVQREEKVAAQRPNGGKFNPWS